MPDFPFIKKDAPSGAPFCFVFGYCCSDSSSSLFNRFDAPPIRRLIHDTGDKRDDVLRAVIQHREIVHGNLGDGVDGVLILLTLLKLRRISAFIVFGVLGALPLTSGVSVQELYRNAMLARTAPQAALSL